jgi:transcriptional regulator with XRE-family HTH domain
MEPTEDKILANIIAIRNKKGFSQDYMASKIGLKQSGYGLIERGDRRLQVFTLLQIALVFEVHVVDLILYPTEFSTREVDDIKATLTVELKKDKKDQVLKLVFGDNNLEILNK